ncbi:MULTISPECIES: DUF4247 domain-containing protein [Streptomyces]|uniref:DUF4247 domain-containing protein n=1 Tax=Streptomyces sudanensis TaxID=436397 RepID=A0ABY4TJP0_9ACTN|nr:MULTISPECIES: DUF4247 domain-containing protein [Streptomyces]MCP9960065.1 DUF4247 domain-containing protein [Streptomyces sudanensis]MCP9989078.1 DUF4247 domain-containing protein [Streptomyces sudanensis]MCP9999538.1 DUF4247 domain-containing protein [Streptomyces sudanensis]URN18395.1 DUF4247 domain-containing protein [Streptomyces sudanensis]
MRTARRSTALLLAAALLAGCGDEPDDDGNPVPSSWIRGQYTSSGADYVDGVDGPAAVADEIHRHSAARERLSSGDMVFLRYRDDIVAVSPYRAGSLIEVDDYRTGYRRWKPHLRSVWPDPDSASFRGGGPGSGK